MGQRSIILTLTDAGRAALVNQAQQKLELQLTGVALGAGTQQLDRMAAALTDQRELQPIFSAPPIVAGQLRIRSQFTDDPPAQYLVNEIAVMAGDVVFAVWSTTDSAQALVVRMPGVPYTATIAVPIAELPAQNISVLIQPLDAAVQQLIADTLVQLQIKLQPQTWDGSGSRPAPRWRGDILLDMSLGGPYGVPLLGVQIDPPAWIQMSGVQQI